MKRIFALLIFLGLMLSLTACGAPSADVPAAASSATPTAEPVSYGDAELDRAFGYHIFPQRFFDDLTAGVSYADYSELMKAVLAALPQADTALYDSYMGKMATLSEPIPPFGYVAG